MSCMDMIDVAPPGLYEAVITEVDEDTRNPDLVTGRYLFRLETRTLDHLRALGGNDAEDELRFATAARLSEINEGLYRTLVSPFLRAMVTEPMAETLRQVHPNRVRFAMFSDDNPLMGAVAPLAERVRAERRPVGGDNPFLELEQAVSSWITTGWKTFGELRDSMTEAIFLSTYGSPFLQSLVGLRPGQPAPERRIERDLAREAIQAHVQAEMQHRYAVGNLEEAVLRAMIYICLPEKAMDERSFQAIRLIRAQRPPEKRLSMARLKELVREQFLLVHMDATRAIETLPALLGDDLGARTAALDIMRKVIVAHAPLSADSQRRLERIEALFRVSPVRAPAEETVHA